MITKWLASAWILACSGPVGCGDDAAEPVSDVLDAVLDTSEVASDVPTEVAPEVVVAPPLPGIAAPIDLTPGSGVVNVQPGLAWSKTRAGRLAVVWTGDSPAGLGVHLGVWDVDGDGAHAVAAPRLFNSGTTGQRNEPAICGLADGGFVGVWSVDLQGVGGTLGVAWRRVDVDGVARDVEDQVFVTERGGNHWLADVGCRPGGGFVLVGVRGALVHGGFEVFVQRFDADGVAEGAPFAAFERASGGQVAPTVGVDQSDAVWVAWDDSPTLDDTTVIAARRFVGATGGELIAAASGGSDAQSAVLAVDPSGGALGGGVIGTKLVLATLGADGTRTTIALPEDASAVTTSAALSPLGDARFAALYFRGTGSQVYARFAILDAAFGEATTLATGSLPLAYRPALATHDDQVAAAWTESLGEGAYAVRVVAFAR